MNVKTTIVFVAALFSAMVVCSCSSDASTNRSPEIANNETLLQLDSLSPCAMTEQEMDRSYGCRPRTYANKEVTKEKPTSPGFLFTIFAAWIPGLS